MKKEMDFTKMDGLIPAVIQDYQTNEVLMIGFMNEEAYQKTLETGRVWYWSRTRNKLWNKGETSGNFQNVKEIFVDCDDDSLLIKVEQVGGITCHTGNRTCFFTKI
ncbi:MAG: phosphoribosyl-AMP cyclohydrolase [bacterium]